MQETRPDVPPLKALWYITARTFKGPETLHTGNTTWRYRAHPKLNISLLIDSREDNWNLLVAFPNRFSIGPAIDWFKVGVLRNHYLKSRVFKTASKQF